MAIPLFTGPLDPSNIENTLNILINEINAQSTPPNAVLGATLAVTAAAGKTYVLNRAAGQAVTLPAAVGSGSIYTFFIGTTVTSNTTTITAAGTDTYAGMAVGLKGNFEAVAGTSHIVTLNGSTQGGFAGDYLIFRDLEVGVWSVECVVEQTGTQATPFS
jgi:hypothetical protein